MDTLAWTFIGGFVHTKFMYWLKSACNDIMFLSNLQKGELSQVQQLIEGLKQKGDINRYTDVLFQCIDMGKQNIAVYLIRNGMRTDIYKQVISITFS